MYPDILPLLRCPACRARLSLSESVTNDAGEIVRGDLCCSTCGTRYAIRNGIADFLGFPRPGTAAQLINELPPTAWAYERVWRPFALTLLSGERFPYRRELPLIAGLVGPQRGGLYLDIACSNGLYARALMRAMGRVPGYVVGIDHARPMLLEARRRARAVGLRISYIRATAQNLPFADGVAAGSVIGGSLNEIGDLDMCLAEARRILAADGRFVTMTLSQAVTRAGRATQCLFAPGGVVFYDPPHLIERFQQHGFRTFFSRQYGVVVFSASVAGS